VNEAPRNHAIAPLQTIAAAALVLATATAAADYPDLILHHGEIYTGDPASPTAQALAITGDRIVALGSNHAMFDLGGPQTRYVDLDHHMVMPGIFDAHTHPVWGALKVLYQCNFPFSAGPDEVAATIQACADTNPEGAWIRGGQWDSDFFVNHDVGSPREFLDAVSGDYAVALTADSGHDGWVNSRALELMGIDADSKDPEGGKIVREPGSSQPNGLLLETAWKHATDKLPDYTAGQHVAAVKEMQRILAGYGITGVKIARADDASLEALAAVEKSGDLAIHVATSLETPYGKREAPLDIETLKKKREKYASAHVNTNAVKIFLDGVPTSSRTAKMVHPYVEDEAHGAHYTGEMHLDPELLARDVIALDRAGFTIKIHAAGDGSVRAALDAFERARYENGGGGPRHEIAHAGFVDPSDLGRFAALNVAPDFSPYLFHPSPIMDSVIGAVGPRGERYWPTRALMDSGAFIVAGSDWPAAVDSANPWIGLEALVTRADPAARFPGTLWGEQAVSLTEALTIMTRNGAAAVGLEGRAGVLAEGKLADLIVLDRNLTRVSPRELGETEVLMTIVEGKPIHGLGEFGKFVTP